MAEEIKNTGRKRKANIVKDVASGNVIFNVVLMKQRWYVLFLFALAIFYITMHYYMEETVRESRKLEQDLNKLRIEYTTRSSELMHISKRSEVDKQIKARGMTLREPQYPAKRIKMN
jgi:predicted membrane protein